MVNYKVKLAEREAELKDNMAVPVVEFKNSKGE